MVRSPLAGKVAIVALDGSPEPTGALLRRLAAEGATVVLVAPPDGAALERAGRLAAEIESSEGGRPAVFALDPNDADGLDGLVAMVTELFGEGAGGRASGGG